MIVNCECANRRATEAAEEIDRLHSGIIEAKRQAREARDIADTLRVENVELRRLRDEAIAGQLAIAERFAELQERESALLSAIKRAEDNQRYAEKMLEITNRTVDELRHVLLCNGLLEFAA